MNRRSFLIAAPAAAGALLLPKIADGSQAPTEKGLRMLYEIPPESGKAVSMCFFNGHVVIACEKAVHYFSTEYIK